MCDLNRLPDRYNESFVEAIRQMRIRRFHNAARYAQGPQSPVPARSALTRLVFRLLGPFQ
jgi:hypothetical protein